MPRVKTSTSQKRRYKNALSPFSPIFTLWKTIWTSISKYLSHKPAIGYVIITLSLMMGVFFMEKGSDIFQASILKETIVFDGTAMPFKQIPDWYAVGGKNTKLFSEYAPSELLPAPQYDLSVLQSSSENRATVNAKITYSIVYMGNYKMDHIESGGSHPGVDIKLPEGTPLYAVANGVVVKAEEKTTGFGNNIVLRHDNVPSYGTLYSGYAHLSDLKVSVGQVVKKGDHIGNSGNTGSSTAPHLHFQIDRDSAPWHPWWPFSTEDAKNAGVSFWEGTNIGLGQSEALKKTIHPMAFVQNHLSYTSSEKPASGQTEASSIDMSISEKEVQQGGSFSLSLRILDANGNLLTKENGNIELSSTDHDIVLPTLRLQNGAANITLTSKNVGRVYVDAKYKTLQKRVSVKVVASSAINTPSPSEKSDKVSVQDGDFAAFEISGASQGVVGKTILLDIRAIDTNGNRTKNVPTKGGFPVETENGTVSKTLLTYKDFQNGLTTLEFVPSERGKASVSIGSAKWEAFVGIGVSQNMAEIAAFSIEGDSYVKGVPNDFFVIAIDANGEQTAQSPFGTITVELSSGQGEVTTQKLSEKDFKNGRAKIVIIPESERISIRAKGGVIVGEKKFSLDRSKVFHDVSLSDPHARAIGYLKESGVINGYADGTFQPKKTVSRAETLKMIFLAFGVEEKQSSKSIFSDIKSEEWYTPFVLSASAIGLVNGYFDGTFRPAQTIVRGEYFKVLLKTIEAPVSAEVDTPPFVDISESDWEAPYAKYAKNEALLDFGTKFYPTQNITREEVAESIYRIIKEQE